MKFTTLLISILLTSIFAVNASAKTSVTSTSNENAKLCSLFTQKADTYKLTMRDDHYAKATLESYKKRADHYCSK